MFFILNIYGEYTVMEQDSNDEVLYVQDTSRSSRNSGGGYSLTYQPSIKDMRSFFDDYHFGLSPT